MFTIKHVTTDHFDPSVVLDGNDIALTLSPSLTVDMTRAQAERLAATLATALGTNT